MGATRLRMDLNLRNLSLISIAVKLWDLQDIKEYNFSAVWEHEYPDEYWCEISKVVVQNANSINLPPSLSALLKNTVLLIGQKIYDWNIYVTDNLELDSISTEKIYFSFGAVDEIKIFDLHWRHLMNTDNFVYQSDYFKHSPLFSLACMYGHERFVKERKNEMLDELSEFYPQIKAGDEIFNIISVSICLTRKKNIIENVGSPQRMFKVCLEAGFSKAARFYWEKLDEVEKVSNLTNFAKKCWRKDEDASFLMEKHCENLLFLMNQMGEEEKSIFFADYADKIIRLFLPIWPYQELVVDLLKYDWNIRSFRLRKMAEVLVSFSISMNHLKFPLDNELLFQIMEKAWGYISMGEKHIFFSTVPISSFFLTLNPKILNLVLNDASNTKVNGKEMDSLIKEGFLELVKMGKFDILNEIIETVSNYIPEPKEFLKENFSDHYFLRDLIKNDESFGLVDQFLDWSAESKEERARLKNKINTIRVCRDLTEPADKLFNIELADKFLKWRLETDAEIESFKEEMKSYNFVIVESSEYIWIKSGDLSWLRPGDSLATHPGENPYDTADGLTFFKFQDGAELNRGVVFGVKSSSFDFERDFFVAEGCPARKWKVNYVGTKAGDFIVFTVCRIWNYKRHPYFNLDEVVNLSDSFIKFYYETDEEVLKFKKTKLHSMVTENLFLLDLVTQPNYLFYGSKAVPENILDEFCKFCMIPSEKIEEIKIQQRSDVENFLRTYLIDKPNFRYADFYLNWWFGKVKKLEVSKKFINSSNEGALLCVSLSDRFGEHCPHYDTDTVSEICRWLSMVDDIEKLKNDLFALNEHIHEWLLAILDRSAHGDKNTICQ